MLDLAIRRAEQMIDKLDLPGEIEKIFGGPSTNSPGSPGSTRPG